MKKAIVCLRRSTLKQEESLKGQLEAIERYAEENDFTIIGEAFVDDGISGAADANKRAGLMAAIEYVEQHKGAIDALLVYDISRLSRDADLAGFVRYRLREAGCSIIYCAENLPDGAPGDLMRGVLEWEKAQYLRQLGRDTIRGLVSAAQKGHATGGRAPFGFCRCVVRAGGEKTVLRDGERAIKAAGDKITFTPSDPEKVALVRRIFSMYVSENLGFWRIADVLNCEGISSPGNNGSRATGWGPSTIRGIISNPAYAGTACFNRKSEHNIFGIVDGRAKELKNKKGRSQNPENEWITFENAFEGIIDKELFERAQEITRQRRKSRNGAASRRRGEGRHDYKESYLLSGLITCGHCGATMVGNRAPVRRAGEIVRYTAHYGCSTYLRRGKSACGRNIIGKEPLEAFVLDHIKQEVFQYDDREQLAQKIRERLSRLEKAGPDVKKELQSQIHAVDKKLGLLTEAFSGENLELLKPQLDTLLKAKGELKRRLDSWAAQNSHEQVDVAVQRALGYLDRLQEGGAKGFTSQLQAAIQAFVHKLTLNFEPVRRTAKRISYRLKQGILEMNSLTTAAATAESSLLVGAGKPAG